MCASSICEKWRWRTWRRQKPRRVTAIILSLEDAHFLTKTPEQHGYLFGAQTRRRLANAGKVENVVKTQVADAGSFVASCWLRDRQGRGSQCTAACSLNCRATWRDKRNDAEARGLTSRGTYISELPPSGVEAEGMLALTCTLQTWKSQFALTCSSSMSVATSTFAD